jgi:hypothetical protein
MKYEIISTSPNINLSNPDLQIIKKTLEDDSELWIPMDPDNTDYQAYLAWVAEGNEAEQGDN